MDLSRRNKARYFFGYVILFATIPWVISCSPAGLAVGTGASLITAAQTEKGVRSSAEDIAIRAEIHHHLFQKHVNLFSAVNLSVHKRRVLLTGAVETPDDRIDATKLAWQAEGVREVINEIQVKNKSSLVNRARDILINKRLQAQLLLDKEIRSINFSSDAVNGTVYLFGIARNQKELDRVINHARNIDYVVNVVNYVSLSSR